MDGVLASLNRGAEHIWQAVAPELPGFTVEVVPEIGSTNTELMQRARTGVFDPVLLVAQHQSAGRGRRGRGWVSAPGDSLTFSLSLPLAPADWSGLSLAVGVSVADRLGPDVKLKWPNDLWWHGRKLGGILVETGNLGGSGGRVAVVGIGINLATPQVAPDPQAALPAVPPVGLREWQPGAEAGALLQTLAPALVRDLLAFQALGFSAFAQRFAQRDALDGHSIRFSDGREGMACGVSEDGALRVLTDNGLELVNSQEVSVRPC